jgi:hypothetical protein
MPECSAYHFKFFVSFIYTGKIHTVSNSSEWHLLCELWILAQALKSTTLKDAVTDAMIERRAMTKDFHMEAYVLLAEHLQTKQQTRTGVGKLVVDTAASCHNHAIYSELRSTNPKCLHFYGEVARVLGRNCCSTESREEVSLRSRTGADCVYHEHSTSEVCYKKMFPATKDSLRQSQDAMPR